MNEKLTLEKNEERKYIRREKFNFKWQINYLHRRKKTCYAETLEKLVKRERKGERKKEHPKICPFCPDTHQKVLFDKCNCRTFFLLN